MEHATRTGPSLLHRCVADLVALGLGVGVSWFGSTVVIRSLGVSGYLGSAAAVIVLACGPFVGAGVRDGLLRHWGALLPPARTPRGLHGILAWGGGFLAAAAPVVAIWMLVLALGSASGEAFQTAGVLSVFTAPTVGVLATRGLCRRWAAPPAASPPPAALASPAPAPLPARPADDPPALPFLPSPA